MGNKELVFHDWKHAYSPEFERTEKILGTTPRQREWVKRAYRAVFNAPEGRQVCAFPVIRDEGFYPHGFVDKIQVHHIMPKGFASYVLGWNDHQINSPFNLIPICETHHLARGLVELDYLNNVVPALHPDMEIARRGYTGKEHPTSYDFAFQDRIEMMKRGEPYWNTDWDRALLQKAEETYYRYLQWQLEKYGKYIDSFPYRKITF